MCIYTCMSYTYIHDMYVLVLYMPRTFGQQAGTPGAQQPRPGGNRYNRGMHATNTYMCMCVYIYIYIYIHNTGNNDNHNNNDDNTNDNNDAMYDL